MKKALFLLFVSCVLSLASCAGGGGAGSFASGGGVGSGGTGITRVSSIGSVTGFGSIFVNGIEFDTSAAVLTLDDLSTLQLGMSVQVEGSINADGISGTASSVTSAADLRGPANINASAGSFVVHGTTVSVDTATVFAGVTGLGGLVSGDPVLVHGLLDTPGSLRATRVERLTASAPPVLSGTVANLNTAAQTFEIGTLTIRYAGAAFVGGFSSGQLVSGAQVRVRARADPLGKVMQASQIQAWYSLSRTDGSNAELEGVVTNYASLARFKLLGTIIDASNAQVIGGPATLVGNGVKVEVEIEGEGEGEGVMANGVLVASKLKIRHVPGTGGPVSFTLAGTIGAFVSAADFRVKSNPVDANGPGVVFSGGTAANLGNGVKVTISGSRVVDGVLLAENVSFTP